VIPSRPLTHLVAKMPPYGRPVEVAACGERNPVRISTLIRWVDCPRCLEADRAKVAAAECAA